MSLENPHSVEGQEATIVSAYHRLANLRENVNIVRASVCGGLLPVGPHETGEAWAVYDYVDPTEDLEYGFSESRREVAVLASLKLREHPNQPAMVRMVALEASRYQTYGYLTWDISVFSDGDAQGFLDFAQAPASPEEPLVPTFSPLFSVIAGAKLELINFKSATPYYGIQDVAGKLPEAVPMGKYNNTVDRAFAVGKALSIIKCLRGVEPRIFGTETTIA